MHPLQLHMPHWPKPLGAEPPGTPAERTRQLLALLGHPERRLPPVLHVGGTKGKGSTIAFLRAMLEAAGYRVHVYSSPHLARFNERITLSGHDISDEALYSALEAVRRIAVPGRFGFFDATTAAAMLAFSETEADILLMEMGLGGAVDATNLLDAPRLTVLTTLSYDHMDVMGETLPEIARFESGLFKPGVPCVVSYQHPSVWPVLQETAAELSAPLYCHGIHWQTARHAQGMIFRDANGHAVLPAPALLGAHQVVNAGNAVAALTALEEYEVSAEHIAQGLQSARWKGRLERFTPSRLPAALELWFDGGHNEAAAEVIALHAREHWGDRPLYLLFGTSEGKDIVAMLRPFAPLVTRCYAVPVPTEPKSAATGAILQAALPLMNAASAPNLRAALDDIADTPGPARALVFGSLYLWLETSMLTA